MYLIALYDEVPVKVVMVTELGDHVFTIDGSPVALSPQPIHHDNFWMCFQTSHRTPSDTLHEKTDWLPLVM